MFRLTVLLVVAASAWAQPTLRRWVRRRAGRGRHRSDDRANDRAAWRYPVPATLTWRELITAMIVYSDNTATNKCIQMAGMDGVSHMMDELGLRHTRLRRKMMDSAAVARGEENVSAPEEMARLVMVYRGKPVDEAASKEILELMKGNRLR